MLRRRILIDDANILVMGMSFKENCPDLRNSKVVDIINELKTYNVNVDVYDPWVDAESAQREYGIAPIREPHPGKYDAIVIAVAHREFREIGRARMRAYGKREHVLYDLKYVLPRGESDLRL
jgi:UDP-N-acetyl-D-galactosamine dehydrogenase